MIRWRNQKVLPVLPSHLCHVGGNCGILHWHRECRNTWRQMKIFGEEKEQLLFTLKPLKKIKLNTVWAVAVILVYIISCNTRPPPPHPSLSLTFLTWFQMLLCCKAGRNHQAAWSPCSWIYALSWMYTPEREGQGRCVIHKSTIKNRL